MREVPVVRRLFASRLAVFYTCLIAVIFISAILAPWISPEDPMKTLAGGILEPPSGSHLFGTDSMGRDVFSRTLHGARISLAVGISARILAIIIGVMIGLFAGYYGGFVDLVLSRLIDSFLAFPPLLLAITFSVALGNGLTTILLALAFSSWAPVARLMRGVVIGIKQSTYIEAARAMGASKMRIIFRHILPNSTSPLLVAATTGIAAAILGESSLSFLGLGADASVPSWGSMIYHGREYIEYAPWVTFFPGLFLLVTVLAFNQLGDMLRDILDPRTKEV